MRYAKFFVLAGKIKCWDGKLTLLRSYWRNWVKTYVFLCCLDIFNSLFCLRTTLQCSLVIIFGSVIIKKRTTDFHAPKPWNLFRIKKIFLIKLLKKRSIKFYLSFEIFRTYISLVIFYCYCVLSSYIVIEPA